MPIYPHRWNPGRARAEHIEFRGVADENCLTGRYSGEPQRLQKDPGIGFRYSELFGDDGEINKAIDSEKLEFGPLHLLGPIGDYSDGAG